MRAARLQPHEALDGVLAVGLGNAGAMIGDAEQHLIALAPRPRSAISRAVTSTPSGCAARSGLPYLMAFSTRLASAWLINSRLP